MGIDKRRRPKYYDRPGKRPGPKEGGSYQNQKVDAATAEAILWLLGRK